MIVGYPLQLSNSDYRESSINARNISLINRKGGYTRYYSTISRKNIITSLSRINSRAFCYRETSGDHN